MLLLAIKAIIPLLMKAYCNLTGAEVTTPPRYSNQTNQKPTKNQPQ